MTCARQHRCLTACILLAGLVASAPAEPPAEPTALCAWFTDAELPGSLRGAAPTPELPRVLGSHGPGVRLTQPVALELPLLQQRNGLLTFWLRPDWNGDDGVCHRLLRIGDPARNGLLLEKSAAGMLRYVMASPAKVTVARADVSHWRAGEWHQVGLAWFSHDDQPIGLPLWIDRVAVDGPIAGGNTFLDPTALPDARLWLGDTTAGATVDELVFRNRFDTEPPHGQLTLVYRDSFRGMPCTAIAIEPDALRVPSDRRVVAGARKQFGLRAGSGAELPLVTDFAVRYGQWADFDAKPLIRWRTSDPAIATVDANGLVSGVAVGRCRLTAEFRGQTDSYDLQVISGDQPDLDLVYVECLPRYASDEQKDRPAPGETVTWVAHVINFGHQPVPAGVSVRFEATPDANRNFRLDADELPVQVHEQKLAAALAPRARTTVSFPWRFADAPTWIRVTVDPRDEVPEVCEANNQTCELSTARPVRFAYNPKDLERHYAEKQVNHVGSYSFYDWINAQKLRFDALLRETVLPCTSPAGVQDAYRTDQYYELALGRWEDEPYVVNEKYFDGGFPVNEPVNLMAIDAAILHEFGHCVIAQPDLYGYPVHEYSVLLSDEQGRPYAGGPLMPRISRHDDILPFSTANGVPCGVGYASLMHDCHLWLHPSQAGHVQWFRGYRGPRFWGSQGRLIPTRQNHLQVFDLDDRPLAGAAVYVYHVTQTGANDAGTKFFADRPKFMGHTAADGRYLFPDHTDADWDDPDTDAFEGEFPVWNPFGRAKTTTGAAHDVAFTPNVWCVEGLLLIKIVAGDQTEFAWLSLTDFNTAFFSGALVEGTYPIRTSLRPVTEVTPLRRVPLPDAVRKSNLRPTAAVDATERTVRCSAEFTLDGSRSSDPEGQPLVYRWHLRGPGDVRLRFSDASVYRGVAPAAPAELEAWFYVIDGLRVSEPVTVKLHVVAADTAAQ